MNVNKLVIPASEARRESVFNKEEDSGQAGMTGNDEKFDLNNV